jgi:hypothetical protein
MRRVLVAMFVAAGMAPHARTLAQSATGETVHLADSTVNRLGSMLANHWMVRVATTWGDFDLAAPRLSATSLHYGALLNRRVFLPDSVKFPDPMPLTWVYTMQQPHRDRAGGALAGGAILGLAGFLLGAIASSGGADGFVNSRQGLVVLGTLGVFVGALAAPRRWTVIYERPLTTSRPPRGTPSPSSR